MTWLPGGHQSGFSGGRNQPVSRVHSLLSWEPHCGGDVCLLTHDWQLPKHGLTALSPILACSEAFVAENEMYFAGDC